MNRRDLLAAWSGVATAWPIAGGAQQRPSAVVGYLSGVSREESVDRVAGFRRGLGDSGFAAARNVVIEFRWADGDYDRLPSLAAELVRLPVAVLLATGGPRAVLAAKEATPSLPIVFTMGADPVRMGVVNSLNRPGGNVTGVSFLTLDLTPKRFDLLRELVPKAKLVAFMVNPNTPSAESQMKSAQDAARASNQSVHIARAGSDSEIDTAFASLPRVRPDALLIGTDAFLAARRKQLTALAARYGIPTFYEGRESVLAGGLISYGPSIDKAHAQAGNYVGRILAGARPADLPVLQPTMFELVINLRTARVLGLTIPQSLLLRADEVIQ